MNKNFIRAFSNFKRGARNFGTSGKFYEIYIEAKSLNPKYKSGVPYYAQEDAKKEALRKYFPEIDKYVTYVVGYEDITIRVFDKDEAIDLVDKLNRKLPRASAEWRDEIPGTRRPHNAHMMEIESYDINDLDDSGETTGVIYPDDAMILRRS